MEATIERPATAEEKKDFIVLSGTSPLDKVFAQIAKKQQEYQLKEKPFCSRCARLDVEEKLHKLRDRQSEKVVNMDTNTKPVDIELDFDKYADSKRFEKLESSPVFENKLVDGMKKSVETGTWENYRCKERGCGLSIFVEKKEANSKK